MWLPLESWARFNGMSKPTQLSAGTAAVYQLQGTNGAVVIKIGSHSANVAGLEAGLGFAPRIIRGFPYIHSLDARKTLQVLLGSFLPLSSSNQGRTVVIDPGHGGRDSGTHSVVTREHEKQYTLDWARRLQRRLEGSGWKVVLTRTNDLDLPLAERIAIADRCNADLFVSLHLNSAISNRDQAGAETYCLTPTGMPSNILRSDEDNPREMHPNNQFDEQNVQLAARLQRCFIQATSAADRGVRRARFMAVLKGQHRPAVLIEGGYLSNPAEARKIADPEYRQAMAEGVARGLME